MTQWRGRFNDGRSAGTVSVRVGLDETWLRITETAGGDLALWALDDIVRVDEEASDGPLRLRLREDDGSRLTVSDRGLREALRGRNLDLGNTRGGARRFAQHFGYAVLGLALLVVVLWLGVPAASRAIAGIVPVAWEEALGERVKAQSIEMFGLLADGDGSECSDGPGVAALRDLVGRLAAVSDSPYKFEVTLVDLDVKNAFALPGGQIVIFDGILDFMEEPQELTAVLAHEMAHVIYRHGTEALIKDVGLSFVFGLLLGDQGDGFLAGLGRNIVGLSYSRDAEAEADFGALTMLESAGLSGDGLALFFSRLAEQEGDLTDALTFLSTHPSSAARSDAAAARAVKGEPGLSDADWAALREACGPRDENSS